MTEPQIIFTGGYIVGALLFLRLLLTMEREPDRELTFSVAECTVLAILTVLWPVVIVVSGTHALIQVLRE